MKMYQFRQQLKDGRKQEKYLDGMFLDRFHIREATRQQERQGIDRIFTNKVTGKQYAIQYKADATAARTGNAFIETVSVDVKDVPGWAYTCQADYIFYYVVGIGPIYIVEPSAIRKRLVRWQNKYQSRQIPNRRKGGFRYNTIGLLVPLSELESISVQVIAT